MREEPGGDPAGDACVKTLKIVGMACQYKELGERILIIACVGYSPPG